jgi:hypothetical protein
MLKRPAKTEQHAYKAPKAKKAAKTVSVATVSVVAQHQA